MMWLRSVSLKRVKCSDGMNRSDFPSRPIPYRIARTQSSARGWPFITVRAPRPAAAIKSVDPTATRRLSRKAMTTIAGINSRKAGSVAPARETLTSKSSVATRTAVDAR